MDWKTITEAEARKPYFQNLMAAVEKEYREQECFPPFDKIMNAMALTPLDAVKCVIVGQDPYHTPGQAMGLSFSIPKGRPLQPSIQNIYKELQDELGIPPAPHGDLTAWAKQGVLLLNAVLTVRSRQPASHQNIGWEKYTDAILTAVNEKPEPVVFMLWGRYARDKARFLNNPAHLVLESAHPSPYSADKGFFGNGHFKRCNQFLADKGVAPINWTIT